MHKKMPATTWLAWVHVFNYFTCLLDRGASVNKSLISLLASVPSITKKNRKKKMTNPVIHDFVASLFLFDEICTSQVFKKKIFAELKDFIEGRLIKNKEYFSSDNVFTTIYDFVKNIVDYLFENSL